MADSGVETGNDSDNSITFDSHKGEMRFVPPAIPVSQTGEVFPFDWQDPKVSRHKLKLKHSCQMKEARLSPYGSVLNSSKNKKLRFAAATNNLELVQKLLEDGADPNTSDEHRRSPLHIAACRGYKEIIHCLVTHGADPNIRDSLGNTPLHLAACTSHIPVVIELLDAGTDVSSHDKHGRNPIQLAQSKLKLIQLRPPGVGAPAETGKLKFEIQMVVQMMLKFLHVQKADISDIEAVRERLESVSTREQVDSEVQCLLNSLNSLNLSH